MYWLRRQGGKDTADLPKPMSIAFGGPIDDMLELDCLPKTSGRDCVDDGNVWRDFNVSVIVKISKAIHSDIFWPID